MKDTPELLQIKAPGGIDVDLVNVPSEPERPILQRKMDIEGLGP
jgi:hypothetical protein